jgi:hypothetical protein
MCGNRHTDLDTLAGARYSISTPVPVKQERQRCVETVTRISTRSLALATRSARL